MSKDKKVTEKVADAKKESKSLFNRKGIEKAKGKAENFVTEVKKFFELMTVTDWILLVVALACGLMTFSKFFGKAGKKFLEKGKEIVTRFKALGFWKGLFLIIVIVWTVDRGVKLVKKYKMLDAKKTAATDEAQVAADNVTDTTEE
jgi:hypothetical protein